MFNVICDVLDVKLRQIIVYLILIRCVPVNVPMSLRVFPEGAIDLRECSVILVLELYRFLIACVGVKVLIEVKFDRTDIGCANEADCEEAMCPVAEYVDSFV